MLLVLVSAWLVLSGAFVLALVIEARISTQVEFLLRVEGAKDACLLLLPHVLFGPLRAQVQ